MLPYFTFLPYFATYFYSSRSSTLLKLFLNHVTYLLHWLDVRLRTVLCSHPWSKFSRSLLIPAAAVWLAGRTDMGSAWTGRAKLTCRFWFSLVAVRSTTAIVRTKNKQSRNPAWNEATLNRIAGSKSMTIALLIYSVTFVLFVSRVVLPPPNQLQNSGVWHHYFHWPWMCHTHTSDMHIMTQVGSWGQISNRQTIETSNQNIKSLIGSRLGGP